MVIGDEIIYVKDLEVTKAAEPDREIEGTAEINGLIRGRAGTAQETHSAGTPFQIFLSHRLTAFQSDAFLPGRTIYYKAVPLELSKQGDIADITAQSIVLTGKAVTPIAPSALRISNFRTSYIDS